MKIDDDEPLVRIERGVCKVIDKNCKIANSKSPWKHLKSFIIIFATVSQIFLDRLINQLQKVRQSQSLEALENVDPVLNDNPRYYLVLKTVSPNICFLPGTRWPCMSKLMLFTTSETLSMPWSTITVASGCDKGAL